MSLDIWDWEEVFTIRKKRLEVSIDAITLTSSTLIVDTEKKTKKKVKYLQRVVDANISIVGRIAQAM